MRKTAPPPFRFACLFVCLPAAFLIATTTPARAQDEMREGEAGRMTKAYFLGVATGGAAVLAGGALGRAFDNTSAGLTFSAGASPIAVGGVVCTIGSGGRYQGPCWAPIAGAYIGGAAGVAAGFFAGAAACTESDDGVGKGLCWATSLLAGYLVGAPAGAVVGFNLVKQPRLEGMAFARARR